MEAIKALEEIQKKQEHEDNVRSLAFELEVAEALARKPETCEPTIRGCAVAYESHDCNGGWKLPIGEVTWLHQNCLIFTFPLELSSMLPFLQEEMRFKWFTKTYKYRLVATPHPYICQKHRERQQNHVKCGCYQSSESPSLLRNDIDVIAVKANCTFIGFEDSSFNGAQMKLPAKPYDRF